MLCFKKVQYMLIYENKMGKNQVMYNRVGCSMHLHHHIELVYVEAGVTDVTIGSSSYTLNAGDAMITFPNQIHSYRNEKSTTNKSYILIYSPDDFPEFKNIFNFKVPVNPVINNAGDEIKELFKLVFIHHNGKNYYKNTLERGYMLVLLSKLFDLLEFTELDSICLSTTQTVLLYCDNNYSSDISLEKISEELYISKFYISRIFNEKIKISFSDYINELRIQDAAQQLKSTTKNISEIADSVGYNNIRSFNRQFIIQLGITPSEYRKANQKVIKASK